MSTGYGWEGLRQVCATLLGACHAVALSTLGSKCSFLLIIFRLY